MAGQPDLKTLFDEVVQELEDEEGLNPETDLTWDHVGEPDFESDYHE